jgi:hypothetical protein
MGVLKGGMVGDCLGIEQHDIREEAGTEQAALAQAKPGRHRAAHFADRLFQGQQLLLAHILCQHTRIGAVRAWVCRPQRRGPGRIKATRVRGDTDPGLAQAQRDETLPAGSLLARGYALTGAEAPVARVELSTDQGATWLPATIREQADRWAWCLWEVRLSLLPGKYQLLVRAWDAAGRTQPRDAHPLWNFKGYANNAWHQVQVSLV